MHRWYISNLNDRIHNQKSSYLLTNLISYEWCFSCVCFRQHSKMTCAAIYKMAVLMSNKILANSYWLLQLMIPQTTTTNKKLDETTPRHTFNGLLLTFHRKKWSKKPKLLLTMRWLIFD